MPPYQSACPVNEVSAEPGSTDLLSVETENCIFNPMDTDGKEGPNEVNPTHTCRRVTFADAHQVHSVLGLEEYTLQEHKGTWPSPYEMYQSKIHTGNLISRLKKGKPCKKEMTYRGLELWTPFRAERLREITSEVQRVVMEEQNRQRELAFHDPEALAARSASISAMSQQRALDLANQDEHEARLCSESDNAKDKSTQQGTRRRWSLSLYKKRS